MAAPPASSRRCRGGPGPRSAVGRAGAVVPRAQPGGTQEGWGGRGRPWPRRQKDGGNSSVQDKLGKVRGCPPWVPSCPAPTAPSLGMGWRRLAPVPHLAVAPALPSAPRGCQPRAHPMAGGRVLAALGATAGCQGRSHCHHPGLLPALQGTTTAPAPWPGVWAQLGRWGAARGLQAGRGLPAARLPRPRPLGQDPPQPLRPQEGAPCSHAAGVSRCQRPCPHPREAGRKPAAAACPCCCCCRRLGAAARWVLARCRRAGGHSTPARQNRAASFKDDQAVTGIKLCFDFLISLICSTPRYGVISPRRRDSSFPP